MTLTEQERQSDLWKKLLAHFDVLIDGLHKDLEKTTLTADQTAIARGRIKQLRQLQGLDKPPAETTGNFDGN